MTTEATKMTAIGPKITLQHTHTGIFKGCWKLSLQSGKISFCTRAKKILEATKTQGDDLSGILNLMLPLQAIQLIRAFKHALATGTHFETKVNIITPARQVKCLRVTGILYYRRWGTPDQMIGVIEDISQQTGEECVSLAIVNHEMRNPLTVIKLNVQMLINMFAGKPDKSALKLLNSLDMQVNCITNLLDEYMTPAPNGQHPSCYNLTVFDLDELINIMINEMRTLFPQHRFSKSTSGSVWVKADKYKIIQVFTNYVTNAVNFSDYSSHISINATIDHNYVEVAVADQGVGIPAGQEEMIFQKFYRGHEKSIRPRDSRGLGLFMVKDIISGHGGSVRAENGTRGGSIFYFSLPVYHRHTGMQPVKIAV